MNITHEPPPYFAGLESGQAETVFRRFAPVADDWEPVALFERERDRIVDLAEKAIAREWEAVCERYAKHRAADERSAVDWLLLEQGDRT